jgi:hypothetical protein
MALVGCKGQNLVSTKEFLRKGEETAGIAGKQRELAGNRGKGRETAGKGENSRERFTNHTHFLVFPREIAGNFP